MEKKSIEILKEFLPLIEFTQYYKIFYLCKRNSITDEYIDIMNTKYQ